MYNLLEMRAYGFTGDETKFVRVGFYIEDEDNEAPIRDIYSDERVPCSCGSNWSLRDAELEARDHETIEALFRLGYKVSQYYHEDWTDLM